MTTQTLRPDGTDGTSGITLTGAASAHAATNDDSDSTYFVAATSGIAVMTLDDFALPAGAVTKQARVRARLNKNASSSADAYVALQLGESSILVTSEFNYIASLATLTGSYVPVSLSDDFIDALRIRASKAGEGGDPRFYELYADLVYVTKPSVAVTAVSPDPYTASTIVPISWVNTLDSDGGGQTRYEIKVFTDAQYGAGGFDPDTSEPYYTTGVVVTTPGIFGLGAETDTEVGPLEDGDTYRAYVRTAQTVNGALHWSDWDYDEFTMDVTTSDIDSVTVTPDDTNARMQIDLLWDSATEPWNFVEIQRSVDGGATWVDVRGATYVAAIAGNTDFQAFDYEAPNGVSTLYRARATYLSSSLPITGSWVESSADSWSSNVPWLKAPNDSGLNVSLGVGRIQANRSRRAGVFQVLGARLPVVVSDVRSGFGGTLPVLTESAAEHADLVALLNGSDVVLVQYPAAWDIDDAYVHVLSDVEEFASLAALQLARTWPLSVVEVDAPADPDAGR